MIFDAVSLKTNTSLFEITLDYNCKRFTNFTCNLLSSLLKSASLAPLLEPDSGRLNVTILDLLEIEPESKLVLPNVVKLNSLML